MPKTDRREYETKFYSAIGRDREIDQKRLAFAVLLRAVQDLMSEPKEPEDRITAEHFIFCDSPDCLTMRELWCQVAGVDIDYIQTKASAAADAAGCTPASEARTLGRITEVA